MSKEKTVVPQEDIIDKYNRVCDRAKMVEELTEEMIMAILSLQRDGVAFKTIQEAYALPNVVLNLIIGPFEAGWEG